ncbi:sigma-54-dependent Fis family transcriptional regulator [Nannocystis bainbridge]|uniref:XylR N-terminal domain-containing protein n=1 Tax=Nannocystis bainbridge TaxID=2995303 RepID=A0ABT5ECI0_9BACT|nr:XylR N-terminal domain-containing protein [Nannocystis bainbridge]MDC0723125.1 XylR N-terminal domain-containing protein [Nannocystis bainbridge]
MSEEGPFVAAGDDDALRLPDSADLLKHLRFWPRDGRITLGDERMVLVHLGAMATLRRELIAAVGVARARAILTRMGYVSGQRDGEYARRIRGTASYYELFAAGPQLHALEGMVAVRPLEVQFDIERGHYRGEFAWRSSAEVEAHLESEGRAAEPVCWTMLGYASGFTTVFMGRPIVYREVACRACGARHCRIVGRPLGDDTPPPEFEFLATHPIARPGPGDPPAALARDDGPVIGHATGLRGAFALLARVAGSELPVLLEGEPGVGKRHLARAVHDRSRRAAGPFVVVRAGALDPAGLADALARARGGSLLLADLDRLSPELQDRLLHAFDAGDHDLRWLASTRVDLRRGGLVRDELVQRLGAFPVWVPPLRERREDIPLLLGRFLDQHARGLGRRLVGVTEAANNALLDHDYPGNVRELWGRIARAAVLVDDGAPIDRGHLFSGDEAPPARLELAPAGVLQPIGAAAGADLPGVDELIGALLDRRAGIDALEQALIRGAVDRAGGNLAAAARLLGLTRPQLAYRFRKTDG